MAFLRTVLCIFALIVLASCTINSEKRLIPLSESTYPLPARFAVVPVGGGGKPTLTVLQRKGRSYIMPVPKDDGTEIPTPVTFFKGPPRSGYLIAEVEDLGEDKSGYHYALARLERDVLTLYTIDNADQLAVFGELSGGRFMQGLKVDSRANLNGAISAMLANPKTLMMEFGQLKVFDLGKPGAEAQAKRFLAEQAKLAQ